MSYGWDQKGGIPHRNKTALLRSYLERRDALGGPPIGAAQLNATMSSGNTSSTCKREAYRRVDIGSTTDELLDHIAQPVHGCHVERRGAIMPKGVSGGGGGLGKLYGWVVAEGAESTQPD
jgi:hypothetical protein